MDPRRLGLAVEAGFPFVLWHRFIQHIDVRQGLCRDGFDRLSAFPALQRLGKSNREHDLRRSQAVTIEPAVRLIPAKQLTLDYPATDERTRVAVVFIVVRSDFVRHRRIPSFHVDVREPASAPVRPPRGGKR